MRSLSAKNIVYPRIFVTNTIKSQYPVGNGYKGNQQVNS